MSSVVVPASVAEKESADGRRLHHMPCRIDHRGAAKVAEFFTPLVRETAPGVLEGQFRGHPLDGATVELPAGYEGVVTRVDEGPDATTYVATEKFSRYTTWNWDRKPSKNDPAARLGDWVEIAETIHSTTEDGD